MKKIIIIILVQLIATLVLAEKPKTVDEFFQQIYSNQPDELSYKKAITKNEKKKILVEINRKNDVLRKLVNNLAEMAKTNASVKEAIINEIVARYKKGIPENYEQSVIESYYRSSLCMCLYELDAHTMLECSNRLIDLGLYSNSAMFNFVRSLRNYWIRGELTAEEIKPIVIACANKKITSAAEILLGLNIGKITRPLDKALGKEYVREWINETTDENTKMQYYRMLNRAGIKEPDYIDLIVKRIEDTKDSPIFSASFVEELVEIGATNKPEIEKLVKELKIEKEEYDKKLKEQIKKQDEIKKNYNPTNVLEFFEKQLEFVKNNNITSLETFIKRLPDFKQQYNMTNFVDLIIIDSQQKNINMKRCMAMYSATNIIQLLEKQLEEAKEYPNPFKEIEKAKKF